ncbi:MAG: hypothetical protein HY698_04910 [Deltaproteobacteria bacterium]|nr:hypothetical protein [Deltaproteobacteria bacterium]
MLLKSTPFALILVSHLVAGAVSAQRAPSSPGNSEAPVVTARSEKGKAEIGEPFHVFITVLHGAEASVALPASLPLGDALGELDRKETSTPLADGRIKRTFDLTIVGYKVGAQSIPRIPLALSAGSNAREIYSDALAIEILSVVGHGREELKPIAPPLSVLWQDYHMAWVLGAVVGGGIASLVVIRLVRRHLRKRRARAATAAMAEDSRPPEEIALDKLRALASSGILDAEDRRPIYFQVTEVVREYLGRRFGFDALEATTAELLEALDRRAPWLPARPDIGAWFEACDFIKYAKVPASRLEAEDALQEAMALVEATRPRLATEMPEVASDSHLPPSAEVVGHGG